MKRIRRAFPLVLVALGALALLLWPASYFWQPIVPFAWPTSGLRQSHDSGFLLLVNGRLFVARQQVTLLGPDAERRGRAPRFMLDWMDDEPPPTVTPGTFYYAVDTMQLGRIQFERRIVGQKSYDGGGDGGGASAGPSHFAGLSWRRGGFAYEAQPKVRFPSWDNSLQAQSSVVAVPLWAGVLLGLPGLALLSRRRQAARRRREGRCLGCGYDLRESSERCPECGQTVSNATTLQ